MPVSLDTQVYCFLAMMGAGTVAGTAFDFLRAWRGYHRPRGWLVPVVDVLFMGVLCIFIASALVWSTWGELRLYVFLAFAAGLGVYYYLGSPYILRLYGWLFRILGFTAAYGRRCARAAYAPVGRLAVGARRSLTGAGRSSRACGGRLWRRLARRMARRK